MVIDIHCPYLSQPAGILHRFFGLLLAERWMGCIIDLHPFRLLKLGINNDPQKAGADRVGDDQLNGQKKDKRTYNKKKGLYAPDGLFTLR